MNRVEVTKLLKRIRAHWNYFNDADYVVDEWLRLLKPYDNYDVNVKLDNYVKDNEKDMPPTPKYMATYLLTPEQKENSKKGILVDCNLCHKTMLLSEYDSHYGKCLKVKTVLLILRKKGKVIEYDELFQYDIKKIERFLEENKVYEKRDFNANKNVIRGTEQIN